MCNVCRETLKALQDDATKSIDGLTDIELSWCTWCRYIEGDTRKPGGICKCSHSRLKKRLFYKGVEKLYPIHLTEFNKDNNCKYYKRDFDRW